jgi:glycerophosphoryl diester phosphodiesterase
MSTIAPENTMAAFRSARDKGIPGVELDIHLLKSGELAVIHDDDAFRTTGVSAHIESSSWADLKSLDAGSWKNPAFLGERIPLLSDLFEEFGPALYYDVEIKSRSASDTGIEAALAALLRDFKLRDKVVVSSFNPFCLARFKRIDPRVPTAIIYCESKELPFFLRRGQGRWIGHTDFLKPERAQARPRAGGRNVVPWTIDDPVTARALVDAGCAGIISNAPDTLGIVRKTE